MGRPQAFALDHDGSTPNSGAAIVTAPPPFRGAKAHYRKVPNPSNTGRLASEAVAGAFGRARESGGGPAAGALQTTPRAAPTALNSRR
jgi:hypothetical protein